MVATSPKKLGGPWTEGYALDVHTTSSTFMGYDEYGHPQFDTERSEIGELLYRLKYGRDDSVIEPIVEVVVNFIRRQKWSLKLAIPVPPSNIDRASQPVFALCRPIANQLGADFCLDCVVKAKNTPELKNIYDLTKRVEILKEAFIIDRRKVENCNVLLFDDLYRSGATLSTITTALYNQGNASAVYALTITMTRSRS